MVVGDHIIPGYIILALAVLVFFGIRSVPWFKDHRFLRFCINTVCVLFAIYGIFKTLVPTEAVNIRVIVTVDDNDREVRASSVWRVMLTGNGEERQGYGNAVIVDLGDKGKLFALLRSSRNQYHGLLELPYDIYNAHIASKRPWSPPKFGEPTKFDLLKALGAAGRIEYRPGDEKIHEEAERQDRPTKPTYERLRPDNSIANYVYPPKLMLFKNINDHSTLRQIDGRFLHAEFGAGVRLKSITAEPTLDPITDNGIENVVPIPSPRGKPPDGWNQRHWELFANDFKGY